MLSLSMIVKNEERFLPGCLESVRGLVDEIVIADTGSTDRTREIAESFGARVVDFPWCDDFSAARNESLRNTSGDWVLYLDADERIDPSFHAELRKLIAGGKGDAFLLNLKSKIGTREGAQYHLVSYPRLFRKMKGVRFSGKVHEQITPALNEVRARILQTDVVVDHLGYAQDDDIILQKARRNKRLLLEQVAKRDNYGYALYQLAQTEIVLGETEAGLEHLDQAIAVGGFGKSVEASVYGIMAENKSKLGEDAAALEACDKSLEAAPQQAFAYMLRGDICMKIGMFAEAQRAFAEALKRYESGVLAGKVSMAIEPVFDVDIIYARLAKAASLAGDTNTAGTYFGKAAREKRTAANVIAFLDFLLRQGKHGEAIDAAREFPEFEIEDWYLRILSSGLIDAGDYAGAIDMLEKLSGHDEVSMSSLANCRMKTGDLAGCESAFKEAVRLGYADPRGLEMLGLVQFKLLKFSEAAGTLSRVVDADPSNARAFKFMQAARAQLLAEAPGK